MYANLAKSLCFLFLFLPSIRTQRGIYTIIAPKTIRPNLLYNVGVSIDAPQATTVVVSIKAAHSSGGSSSSTQQAVLQPGSSQLIGLQVGDLSDGGTYNLTVKGEGGLDLESSTELKYSPKSASILIQTDKPLYKPEETVNFRVLLLDRSLRPRGPGPLNIVIKDSESNVVKQWKNAVAEKGLFSNKFSLSSRPNLGDWTIQINLKSQEETHTFSVSEYVLPKFNVDILTPPFGTFDNPKITVKVKSTYVYGKPVKGELVVSAFPTIHSTYIQPVFSGIARKSVRIDGEASVDFDLVKELQLTDDYKRLIQIEATVTERLTSRQQNATTTFTLHKNPFKLEFIRGSQCFKPGLPYKFTIKVATQDDVPIRDEDPKALKVQFGYSYSHDEYETKYFSIPATGLVDVVIDTPSNDSIVVLGLEATYKDLTEWFPTVQKALSKTETYLQINKVSGPAKVNSEVTIEVKATEYFGTLNYNILGRGDLLISRKLVLSNPTDKVNFRILLPPNAAPKATVLVYIINEDEIIADSLDINVGGMLNNFLNVSANPSETEPGREVELEVISRPKSLIGLRGIDQSILILKEDNDINMQSVKEELGSWGDGLSSKMGGMVDFFPSFNPIGSVTASKVFEDAGVVVLTNGVVFEQPPTRNLNPVITTSRPLRKGLPRIGSSTSTLKPDIGPGLLYTGPTRPPRAGIYAFSRIPKSVLSTHRIFLSNVNQEPSASWLFDNMTTGYNGRTSIQRKVPDTLTSWIISGFSLDPVYGLGLLEEPTELKVFRPFFVSLNLPYSIIKGEAVGVQVLVHNYFNREVTADVSLDNSKNEFIFTEDENEIEAKLELFKMEKVTVPAKSVRSVTFLLTPTKIGTIDLKVKATSSRAGDEIIKPLRVVPPGHPQKLSKTALLDLRLGSSNRINLTTELPPKRVPESEFVKVSVISDILGPTINNLDKLLEMPTGCGEQNMVHFVPDIVILEYLQSTRQLTQGIRDKATKYLEEGYQRELTYRHDDGSFSAFGKRDETGSTWLTAFVIRAFVAAKAHIFIETRIIEEAMNWLISKQMNDGSFIEIGKIFDTSLPGASSQGLALSAFVTLSLIEANADPDVKTDGKVSTSISLALNHLSKGLDGNEDPYALSIISYALHIANHPLRDGAFNLMERLRKIDDSGKTYWEPLKTELDSKNPWTKNVKPSSIEATSYALLTYARKNLISDSVPVLRWLLEKRNAYGGFISTQDTVVGISALGAIGKLISSPDVSMKVDVFYEDGQHSFSVNRDNSITLQEHELPSSTEFVQIDATGSGIALVELTWGYNLDVVGPWPLFNLDPQVDRTSTSNQLQLSVCTDFIGEDDSNMAVMEMNMPSGFEANKEKLTNLLHYPQIKHFETDSAKSKVVVYFNSLKRNETVCPTVSAYRVFPVAKQAPAYVTMYDYYDNSRRARQFYDVPRATLCDICDEPQCSTECLLARQQQAEEEAQKGVSSANSIFSTLPLILSVTFTLYSIKCV